MTADPFARATATTAHQRATTLEQRAQALEQRVQTLTKLVGQRPQAHAGLCCLCGWPTTRSSRYCRAHSWAAGV